jgi:putative cobalt transporter subunit CbtA
MAVQGRPVGSGARDAARAGGPAAAAGGVTGAGAFLRRGMGAGLVAGVATGLFELVAGEPSVGRAIELERMAQMGAGHSAEVFTRGVQRAGMVMATGLYGIALGGVLAVVLFVMARRIPSPASAWQRSMKIALAGFGAFWFVPFLKYPANPPAVGDPATIGLRTASYLAMAAVSVGACFVGAAAARRLAAQGAAPHRRQIVAGAAYGALALTAFVALPANPDAVNIPADLLWNFRLASAGGQAILWTVAGMMLGLLTLRAERRAAAAERRPAAS